MMLVLGWLENMLPSVGVPGVKLGLSNGVLIFAVYMLDLPAAWILMALKVTLSGFLFGNPSAMLYSFSGGALSMAVMSLLSRTRLTPLFVSPAGGIAHNVGQVLCAMVILRAPRQMLYYLAVLSAVGAATGFLTGFIARAVMAHLRSARWAAPARGGRRASAAMVLLSVAAVLAAGFVAWSTLRRPAAVTVTTSVSTATDATATDVRLMDLKDLGIGK